MKKFKKALPVLLAVSLAMTGLTGCGEKTTYEHTIELGENYTFDATEIFGVSKKEAKEYEAILTTLDTNTAGEYEVKVLKGNKEYTVIYTVKDTKAPEVKLNDKYLFTNNIEKTEFEKYIDVKDASKVKQSLCKFEKLDDLKVLTPEDIEEYTKNITNTKKTKELLKRLDDTAETEGIYNAVYLAEDKYGHQTAKEVIVIYDTQNPSFMGTEDIPEEVKVTDGTIDTADMMLDKLVVTDNCDGVISADSLDVKAELIDAAKNTYKIDVSYTDRAGNTAGAQYNITFKTDGDAAVSVKVDSDSTENKKNNSGSSSNTGTDKTDTENSGGKADTGNSGSNSNAGSSESNSDTGNSGSDSNSGSNNTNTGNTNSGNSESSTNTESGNTDTGSTNTDTGTTTSPSPQYSYDDLDGDGYADLGPVTEMNGFLIPTEDILPDRAKDQKALSEAGYYNPILLSDGKTYAMIIPFGEDYYDFFDNWLRENPEIQASSFGCCTWDIEEKAEYVDCSNYIYIKDIITDEI